MKAGNGTMFNCGNRHTPVSVAFFTLLFWSSSTAFQPSIRTTRPQHPSLVTRFVLKGIGSPSYPGWKSGRLDRLTDWAESKKPNRPIICEYKPNGFWLWRKWTGTVLQATWGSVLVAVLAGVFLDAAVARTYMTKRALFSLPNPNEPLIIGLAGLKKMWEYQLTIATFVLAFFLSQSFSHWQSIYNTARAIQGRANDFCFLVTMGAKRNSSQNNKYYDKASEKLVQRCTRLVRMSHIFFWAATKTASNGLTDSEDFLTDTEMCPLPFEDERIGPVLLSPYGLQALVDSDQLTQDEATALLQSGLPPSQYAYILLTWVGMHAMDGMEKGLLRGGNGFEGNLLDQLTRLRGSMFDIDDLRAGRMPLAYVQLVQVLIDSLIMVAPFALYSDLGSLSTPLVGLMAFFFRGLLVLSKSFLDPFGVDGFENQNIRVDTLVSELNFGASERWIKAGKSLPTSTATEKE